MLRGGWNLGGYGYVDRQRTETRNGFSQVTMGAEALGRDWDLRANVYLPQGEQVKEGATVGGGASTAAIVGAVIEITTPGSQTLEERALKGMDAEVGWRAPLWDAEAERQLRLYAGGYRFRDSVVSVSGTRVRAELAMYEVPHLWHGAQLRVGAEYQDDNARGSQGFVWVRLRIPLGGKEELARRLTAQERRMTDPVVRDVDIVTQTHVVSSTPTLVEPAVETAGGQPITVISSASTAGSALPAAVAGAGPNSTVILSGSFNTAATTTLQAGQTLMGAGTLSVRSASGRTASLTTPTATLSGTTTAGSPQLIDLANNSTVTGLSVSVANTGGTGAIGIRASGVTGATLANNIVTSSETGGNTADGVAIVSGAAVTVRSNTISAASTAGNAANAVLVNGASATVAGNTLSATGGTSNSTVLLNSANIIAGSSGNIATAGNCTVTLAGTGGTVTFTNAAPCGP